MSLERNENVQTEISMLGKFAVVVHDEFEVLGSLPGHLVYRLFQQLFGRGKFL